MSGVVLKDLKILIVEDEKDIRESMAEAMRYVFSDVITAQNGDEGVKKFRKFNPNMVITDIAMPIMDGLDMTKNLKKISPNTPIIALSAFSDKDKLLKAIDVGIDKYLLKPIDMDELLVAIETLAKNKIDALGDIVLADGYVFSQVKKVLLKDNKEIALTKKELAFISLLINRLGTLVLHEDIKTNVWIGEKASDAAIRTFIKRVRDKVGADMIKNVPGLGYKIEVLQ
ncbi:response regulator transcription factor [Campylobacter geochelonis]|uniref:DNA-binding response regulator n=1 Tax=Campylobacter geochelonis TaxID=1780362 RepID=A0A128EJD9_9BACT|nr:response regulator transcription factor [Campylobacter geochelonis]QKF71983.1 two-component system response regulator [Campylobacter geochelonis]CZE47746.1 DNA-binding response regulator [Campylobacter geochelonis]CZE48974.1 DNA-binding response regulator [Campylobacter geochelonis]CZE49933.1 DNA-binding response regulator [Campylobacter geochelonis]